MRTYVAIVGIVLGIIGFILLATPVSVNVGANSYPCGTGAYRDPGKVAHVDLMADLNAGPYGTPSMSGADRCDDAIAGRRGWAFPLLIGGALVAIGAGVATAQARRKAKDVTPA
ncbi:hypothetical protein DMH04_41210 [Kibdelosporangium aridum]|uniref:Uncharacterized protein n=1 Tax=Kibdelosporangium aridum TaxID=2030 RepID=A0A428YUN9_KIBAR|nr:hypothetical protein [Kibdelosporangium aridum]RSM73433.1 hypothetical protein DMH04_41210 [Kibdelosporangium aridum]